MAQMQTTAIMRLICGWSVFDDWVSEIVQGQVWTWRFQACLQGAISASRDRNSLPSNSASRAATYWRQIKFSKKQLHHMAPRLLSRTMTQAFARQTLYWDRSFGKFSHAHRTCNFRKRAFQNRKPRSRNFLGKQRWWKEFYWSSRRKVFWFNCWSTFASFQVSLSSCTIIPDHNSSISFQANFIANLPVPYPETYAIDFLVPSSARNSGCLFPRLVERFQYWTRPLLTSDPHSLLNCIVRWIDATNAIIWHTMNC